MTEHNPNLHQKWHFAAFSCFAATTLVFSPNTSIFSGMAMGEEFGLFIFPMFVTACVTSGALAVYFHLHGPERVRSFPVLAVAACVHIAAAGLVVACNYGAGIGQAGVVTAGIAYGASLVALCLTWANILGRVEFRKGILTCTVVCVVSYAISVGLAAMPEAARGVCYMAVLAFGALAPVVILRTQETVWTAQTGTNDNGAGKNADGGLDATSIGANRSAGRSADGAANDANGPKAANSQTVDLLATLRLPLVGLLLFAFMMALGKNRVLDIVDSEHFAGFVAALCILPLFAIRRDKPLSSLIYRVISPAIGGVVVVLLAFPADSGVHGVAFVCAYVFMTALAILAFATVLAIINAGEFSAEFVTSLGLFAGCAVSLAGIYWAQVHGGPQDSSAAVLVMVAFYCAFMMIYLGWESWKLVNAPSDERVAAAGASQDWAVRAEAAKLTKREVEILSYLGRGHSIIYIAEKLFISESTVRTHVKHIYAKLGVHSKEELFAFVDGEGS